MKTGELLKSIVRFKVWLLLIMLFLSALLMGATHLLLATLPTQVERLEQLLSTDQYQTRIKSLSGRWDNLTPIVEIEGLSLTSATAASAQPLLQAEQAQLDFSPFYSLLHWQWVFDSIWVRGLNLGLVADADHGWHLEGIAPANAESTPPEKDAESPWLNWLLAQRNIEIEQARLQFMLAGGRQLAPQTLDLSYQKRLFDYRFSARLAADGDTSSGFHAAAPGSTPTSATAASSGVKLIMQGQGVPGTTGFNGDFYAHFPESALRSWLPLLAFYAPAIDTLQAGTELWGHWQAGELNSIRGRLSVAELSLNYAGETVPWALTPVLPAMQSAEQTSAPTVAQAPQQEQAAAPFLAAVPLLQDASAEFELRASGTPTPEYWRLQLQQLQGQWQGVDMPLNELAVELQGQDHSKLTFSSRRLRVGALVQSLRNSPWLPDKARQQLSVREPAGELLNISGVVADVPALLQGELQAAGLSGQADAASMSVQGHGGAPTIRGIEGRVEVEGLSGRIDLKSRDFYLGFPELFSNGWQFRQAQGVLHWNIRPERLQLLSEHLHMALPDIAADGRFALDVPWQQGEASEFTLMIGMTDSDASQPARFMPDKKLNPELYQWVEQSINKARMQRGGFIYHGALESQAPEPSIQMYFDVADANIRYQPDWPAVSNVAGQVLVKGESLLVALQQGQSFDSKLQTGTQVRLSEAASLLTVKGALTGPAADVKATLMASPLATELGEQFAAWDLSGTARTELDLGLNLKDMESSRIQVRSELTQGRYASAALGLAFTDINGTLSYSEERGLNSEGEGLSARFFDRPINVSIRSEASAEGMRTRIRGQGSLAMTDLENWLQQPLLSRLSGETEYEAELDICAYSDDCTRLNINTDLRGVAADLPPPFAKAANTAIPLTVRNQWAEDRHWLRVQYGEQLHTLLLLQDAELQGGELVLGPGQEPPQSRRDGLYIRGQVPRFDSEQWQQLAAGMGHEQAPETALSRGGLIRIDPLLRSLDLHIGRLALGEYLIDDLQLGMSPRDNYWRLNLQAPEVAGYIELPQQANLAYRIILSRLYLPATAEAANSEDAASDTADEDPLADYDPRDLPGVVIDIDDLRRGDERYGAWAFHAKPVAEGLEFSDINGEIHKLKVSANLQWLMNESGMQTQLDYQLQAPDLAAVQRDWQEVVLMEGQDASLEGQFKWPGSPLNFALAELSGKAVFEVSNGRFLDAGSAGGIVRVFGILNFKTIGRRLRLDFSDLAKEGYSFDTLSGSYTLNSGQATSDSPLKIDGPSADMRLVGSFDLVEETLNQRLDVALPVAENLSLGAVLLGTPYVAGAVYLFDKLMGSPLSNVATASYQITGPWADPQVKPLNKKAKAAADEAAADKTSPP